MIFDKENLIKEIIDFRNISTSDIEKSQEKFDRISIRIYILNTFFGLNFKDICYECDFDNPKRCRPYYARGHKLWLRLF